MMKPLTWFPAILALALLAGGAAAQAADAPKGDAAKGKVHFLNDGCAFCHGTVGQGGGGRTGGLRLAQMGIGFAAFLNQLRQPANEMPPYVAAALSDQDVADIYAYVVGLPPAPDVKTIPILNN
jgi:mono/diheme cytochrome c family protein